MAEIMIISTFMAGLASAALKHAREGGAMSAAHASHTVFISAYSAMSARMIATNRSRLLSVPISAGDGGAGALADAETFDKS
jgi:hypothetical protein